VLPPAWTAPPVSSKYQVVNLVAPPSPPPAPKPLHFRMPPKQVIETPPKLPPIQVPRLEARRMVPPPVPLRRLVMPKPVVAPRLPVVQPPRPLPKVHLGVLSNGSSAKPTVHLPAAKVQTGGFGSPAGITGQNLGGSKGNVPRLGSFDLPSGPGSGNGTGGAQGVRGVIASAGFGNGVAIARTADSDAPARGVVQPSGFGNAVAGKAGRRSNLAEAKPNFQPAVILSKPDPVYPAEARRLHIEGEVLLDVIFQADGRVRVVRVVRGLGHGLDQSAVQAAEHIVFRPARRAGRPVDSEAIARLVFRLAY
jgi:TonB family protein